MGCEERANRLVAPIAVTLVNRRNEKRESRFARGNSKNDLLDIMHTSQELRHAEHIIGQATRQTDLLVFRGGQEVGTLKGIDRQLHLAEKEIR